MLSYQKHKRSSSTATSSVLDVNVQNVLDFVGFRIFIFCCARCVLQSHRLDASMLAILSNENVNLFILVKLDD